MSRQVTPAELATTAAPYGTTAFLLYVGASGSVRVNHVVVESITTDDAGTIVRCRGYGRGLPDRVSIEPTISLLWPAPNEAAFSLIADGTGRVDGSALEFAVVSAVLHRPAPIDGDVDC